MVDYSSIIGDAKKAVQVSDNAFKRDLVGSSPIEFADCCRIYYSSNEYLASLFKNFSVAGKDILCVSGSGDQAFHCINRGANSVDLFDINKLSKYYFYLRCWGIKYLNTFYPSINEFLDSHDWIKKVLKSVDISSLRGDEMDSFYFWSLYISEQNYDVLNRKLFYLCSRPHINSISDVSKLSGLIDDKDIAFFQKDICSDDVVLPKKYDIVIMSNILEYCKGDKLKLKKACDNLHGLLNNNGEVICSRLTQLDYEVGSHIETSVFDEMFEKEEFPFDYDPLFNKRVPVGYSYKKR